MPFYFLTLCLILWPIQVKHIIMILQMQTNTGCFTLQTLEVITYCALYSAEDSIVLYSWQNI